MENSNNNCNSNQNSHNQGVPMNNETIDLTRFGTIENTPYEGLSRIEILDITIELLREQLFSDPLLEGIEEENNPQNNPQNNQNQIQTKQ